ncbi:hypothetical protein BJ508DRAFT_364376 [Ascobolus immersus RN42]|uniref:F-box domain-containing protein n=1 Tax=Ascobolus immersus RN42 TaxID=1160509 RepID=A0A3N4HUR2_ASCIM|nr:hypothetical protein BJ508DRAFT_364376 [Ascobolus immersus RN42]
MALPNTTTGPSLLLRLPTEIRLEIYQHCSTFALLQIASTSSLLHSEVNEYPALIRASYGFRSLKTDGDDDKEWKGLEIKHVRQLPDEQEELLWNAQRLITCEKCHSTVHHNPIVAESSAACTVLFYKCTCGWTRKVYFDVGEESVLHDCEEEDCGCFNCWMNGKGSPMAMFESLRSEGFDLRQFVNSLGLGAGLGL